MALNATNYSKIVLLAGHATPGNVIMSAPPNPSFSGDSWPDASSVRSGTLFGAGKIGSTDGQLTGTLAVCAVVRTGGCTHL